MSDIIDDIDALINESLAAGPVDDYTVNRYDKCWHCGRDWHGMPITAHIEAMRRTGRYEEGLSPGRRRQPRALPWISCR